MPALVIKDLPAEIHQRLKDEAELHHRSMTQEAIVILEQGLQRARPIPAFKAFGDLVIVQSKFKSRENRI